MSLALIAQLATAFVQSAPRLGASKLALSSKAAVSTMSLVESAAAPFEFASSMTTAMGLEVNFGGFLAVVLGVSIPVVFLVIIFIKSNAEGTATTFRWPDLDGGELFDTDGSQSRFGTVNGVDRSKFLKDDRQ